MQYKEPIFTKDELDENKTHVSFGYKNFELMGGHDFVNKPMAGKIAKQLTAAKEKIDGTAKKRECHAKINSFGWAKIADNKIIFGIKFSSFSGGPTKLGENVVNKYKQLLGYLLEKSGWKQIESNRFGDYEIPLTNEDNLKTLCTLSPSIGFHYKSAAPDMEFIEKMKFEIAQQKKQSRTNAGRGAREA